MAVVPSDEPSSRTMSRRFRCDCARMLSTCAPMNRSPLYEGSSTAAGASPGGARAGSPSAAAGAVFKAHDVVLAQVAAGLDFDQIERLASRVLQAVLRAEWDEGRFVLAHIEHLLATSHPRGPRDHDPMLRAMLVHLQRKALPRLHHDALHLEAVAGVYGLVVAPGTVDPRMGQVLRTLALAECLDQLANFLRAGAIGDQHRIVGLDHHQVLD